MARDTSVHRQRQRQRSNKRDSMMNLLENLAVVLIAETQDSGDQLISLAFVALDRRRRNRRSGIRYGK
jgi:hypothetical protein